MESGKADKSLSNKAIDFKGSKYVLVSDRVIFFNETYPNGSIVTELVNNVDDPIIVMKAIVTPDVDKPERKFVDYSQAKWGDGFVNKTSALENCSTSAVGRALAYLGIGVIDSIASVDEINKAQTSQPVDSVLLESRQSVYKAFQKAGVKDTATMKDVIRNALGHDTIDSVDDAELVIQTIEAGNESS